ncbi:MAG: ATP-grasp domain-containing protein [Pseudomonadota bacterium]|nr:MAG: ATP-grasp domain-containing protein [Pseudomonadota bacterium]
MRKPTPDVLLCEAGFSSVPLFYAMRAVGHQVMVIGNLADDPLHGIADRSELIDYSDHDAVDEAIVGRDIRFLVPGCNDVSYWCAVLIAEDRGFPGFDPKEVVSKFIFKDAFREHARKKGYRVPSAALSMESAQSLNPPILVKPADVSGGKGMTLVEDLGAMERAWDYAEMTSPTGRALAEEFIEGQLYSHSAFLNNKEIVLDFFVTEYCTVYPFQVNSSHLSHDLDSVVSEGLRDWTHSFAEDLDLCDGLLHTQFIVDKNHEYWLIEVTRRCPGDLYAELIRKSTGIDYASLYCMPLCGRPLEVPEKAAKRVKYISRHTASVSRAGIFLSSQANLENASVSVVPLKMMGQKLAPSPFDKTGIFFIENADAETMVKRTPSLHEEVIVEMADDWKDA